MTSIGNAIKLCRVAKSLSQTDLAKSADVSVSYLSLLECDKRDPVMSTIERIASALAVPLPVLMFLAHDKGEIYGISPEIAEKLAALALFLIAAAE